MKKVITMLLLFSTVVFAQQKGTFTDSRDNKTYKAVKIAQAWWMAENLNYAASGSKCYDNNSWNCTKYGRLYDWNAAMRACPYGWHLPSNAEWDMLVAYAGGEETAGKNLNAKSGWYDGNGTDQYGFSALPGGYGEWDGSFNFVGLFGYWWSATESNTSNAYGWGISHIRIIFSYNTHKSDLYSVRCVQD